MVSNDVTLFPSKDVFYDGLPTITAEKARFSSKFRAIPSDSYLTLLFSTNANDVYCRRACYRLRIVEIITLRPCWQPPSSSALDTAIRPGNTDIHSVLSLPGATYRQLFSLHQSCLAPVVVLNLEACRRTVN
ncbi:hypothetical protein PAXRUDRAFT_642800 [Paxillus rubicundulus Ve08.2h10]|uniref:Uncharacterized protein n=1 Tax=Paxillus rubicundulus Ve08.2h10 TaxID=930991 RepID=A0A0D0DJC6_9AGAM|nr:hypothetical protein PAXRUDRAFT_642800 [Paxillus rubicundulus Ve08.2h10]